jgi:hypothetical protein
MRGSETRRARNQCPAIMLVIIQSTRMIGVAQAHSPELSFTGSSAALIDVSDPTSNARKLPPVSSLGGITI